MKKRLLSTLIALSLFLGLSVLPANAWSGPLDHEEWVAESITESFDPDDGGYGAAALTGLDMKFYEWLKADCARIANGTETYSVFEYKDIQSLNIISRDGKLQNLNTRAILTALLMDCPYEMFWYDKVKGWTYEWSRNTQTGLVSRITFKCPVIQSYARPGTESKIYDSDAGKIQAANASLENAQAVVNQNSGRSDYEKLAAYRDYVCDQVEYNDAAAGTGSDSYGDPWQMIYVFDNDPSTNVVCEGYAKAFKYLCDISTFSNQVDCYLISGYTTGSHMWNIVRINGQSYLTDVTACDSNPQSCEGLFLAGSTDSTAKGCTIKMARYNLPDGRYYRERTSSYTYKEETMSLYGDILLLAPSGYDPAAAPPPVEVPPVSTPSFTDVPGWCAEAVNWAVDKDITKGVGNNRFAPGKDCTYVEILTFLWRAEDRPGSTATAFSNLAGDYAPAANWAYEEKLIDDSFEPGALCTRAQAVSYIWQVFKSQKAGASSFSDVDAGADYAAAVNWAVENGIVEGYTDGTFRPDTVCNRGVIVTMLQRAYVPEARLK